MQVFDLPVKHVPQNTTTVIVDPNTSKSSFSLPILTHVSSPPLGGESSLIKIKPLATRLLAWKAVLGVSDWVLKTIELGYSLQFAHRPSVFRGVVQT